MSIRKIIMIFACGMAIHSLSAQAVLNESFDNQELKSGLSIRNVDLAKIEKGILTLRGRGGKNETSALMTSENLFNGEYKLSLDFMPVKEPCDGYAFTFGHLDTEKNRYLWYVEFGAANHFFTVYRTFNNKWELVVQSAPQSLAQWYRMEVKNGADQCSIRIVERSGGKEILNMENIKHDNLPGGLLMITPNSEGAIKQPDMTLLVDEINLVGANMGNLAKKKEIPAVPEKINKIWSLKGLNAWQDAKGTLYFGISEQPTIRLQPLVEANGKKLSYSGQGKIEINKDSPAFTGIWDFPEAGVSLSLDGRLEDDKSTVRFRLSAKNTDGKEKWICALLPFEYLGSTGFASRQIAFQKRWLTQTKPLVFTLNPLEFYETRADFGTWIFAWGEQEGVIRDELTGQIRADTLRPSPLDLYIPMICGMNNSGGTALFTDPRNSWGFAWGQERQLLTRRFFLPAEKGFVDSSLSDGAEEVPYECFLHLTPVPDWGNLYANVYLPRFPFLSTPATVKAPNGAFGGGTGFAGEEGDRDLKRYVEMGGIRLMGGGDNFLPEEKAKDVMDLIPKFKRLGVKTYLWTNIRMAPDAKLDGRLTDPEFQYAKFEDSLVKNQKGEIVKCWSGYSVNPSPRFSFGKYHIKRLLDWIDRYGQDGVFLDLYDDTVDVDWGHAYKQYPFFPLQIAEIEFIKALSEALHKRGKFLVVNAPHPSMQVQPFADAYGSDPMNQDACFWYKLQLPGKPFYYLPNPSGGKETVNSASWYGEALSRLHYGVIPCLQSWNAGFPHGLTSAKDPETVLAVFQPNIGFWEWLSQGRLIGGGEDPFRELHHKLDDGTHVISHRNPSEAIESFSWQIPESFFEGEKCDLIEWSLTDGARKIASGLTAVNESVKKQTRFLLPKDALFLVIVPSGRTEELLKKWMVKPEEAIRTKAVGK